MDKKEMGKAKKEIENFINSDKKVLELDYKGDSLNAAKYYHKIMLGNPIKFFFNFILMVFCSFLPVSEFKNSIYRSLGMKIGKDVSIPTGVGFDFLHPELMTIKDGALIGAGTKFFTHEGTITGVRIGKITIGEKALIGIRSTIRSGVTIGDNSIVGMCSFVNKDVKDSEFVGGVPAKRIKKLSKN